jgi:hypothetical protein
MGTAWSARILFVWSCTMIAAQAQELHLTTLKTMPDWASLTPERVPQHAPEAVSGASRKLWWTSVAALAASTAVDAHSSWGKYEGNALLSGSNGQFGQRGVYLKVGVSSAWVAAQAVILRKHRSHRALAIVNFAVSAALSVAACHNYGIPSGGR